MFIDNEAARFSLIKGRSPSDPMFRMAHACSCMDAVMPSYSWYERVASFCNPADLPSRDKAEEACLMWNLQFAGDIALPAQLLVALLDGGPFPKAAFQNGDLEWVISERGRSKDDNMQ